MTVVAVKEMKKDQRVTSQVTMQGDMGSVYGGTIVDSKLSINDALREAGLDWDVAVDKVRMAKKVGGKVVPGFFATYRMDTGDPLGIVKTRYVPMQNRDAFRPFDIFLGDEACIESAGALHNGRYTWVCIDLGSFDILPGDQIKKHLLLINSHDGSSNILAQLLPNRLACQNMLNFDLGAGGGSEPMKIRHTGSAMIRLDEVKNIFALANNGFGLVKESFEIMRDHKITAEEHRAIVLASLKVTKEDLQKFFNGDYKKQPQWVGHEQEINRVMEVGPGMDMAGLRGTVYGTYQAITAYQDHYRHVRGSGANPDNAIESKILGHAAERKMDAFKACMEFCQN